MARVAPLTREALEAFLQASPRSHHAAEATERLRLMEEAEWEASRQAGTPTGYEDYLEQYPNVTVKYEVHDSDWSTKLKVEMAGGTPPDLVFSSDDAMFSFAARGTHVDLAPFF